MQQLVALRALRWFPYFTQRKTLRCVRCVVKETAPNASHLTSMRQYYTWSCSSTVSSVFVTISLSRFKQVFTIFTIQCFRHAILLIQSIPVLVHCALDVTIQQLKVASLLMVRCREFLPHDATQSAVLLWQVVCLSVCLSVCP